jgi:mannosyl-oligosaccharide alpha-1,2-mannosidase
VRDAVVHAWRGYLRYAADSDDLRPVSRGGDNWLQARATLYDSLDTLYVVGLHAEVGSECFRYVYVVLSALCARKNLTTRCATPFLQFDAAVEEYVDVAVWRSPVRWWLRGVPTSIIFSSKTFEYHIRVVGGLLGAFSVSGRRSLLFAARRAADSVLAAFLDVPNGVPRPHVRAAPPLSVAPLLAGVARILDAARAATDKGQWRTSLAGVCARDCDCCFFCRRVRRISHSRVHACTRAHA